MEGFWVVQFIGVEGWGAGVVTLVNGKVFGGDSGYLFMGTYTENGNSFGAQIHVKQHTGGIANVMGQSEFDLQLNGTLSGAVISFSGAIPGTQLQIKGELKKQSAMN